MKYKLLLIILCVHGFSYSTTITNNIDSLGIQTDLKIMGIGLNRVNSTYTLTATRYNIDGSIDTAYGSSGVASSSINPVSRYAVTGVTDSSNRTLVFGTSTTTTLTGVRFLSTGVVDPAFTLASSISIGVQDAIVDASGAVVVCGSDVVNGALVGKIVRLTTAGALDTTFNGTGQLNVSPSSEPTQLQAIIQTGTNYVVAGYSLVGGQANAFLARYTSAGVLDTTFGTGGYIFDTYGGGNTKAYALKVQPDGKIVVVGNVDGSLFIARYITNGTLDPFFAFAGLGFTTNNFANVTMATDVAIQANGAIMVTGTTDVYALAVRYTSSGFVDTSFNAVGYATIQIGDQAKAQSLAILPSGNILIGGNFDVDSPFIVQFTSTGSNYTLFGQSGVVSQIMGNPLSNLYGNCVRVDKLYGNDSRGERNGAPFLTITAALAQALSGDVCWVFPGRYEESITVPNGVTVKGLNQSSVIISRTGVTAATDVITMGENSAVENLTVSLTSAIHAQMRAVVFPSTTTQTSCIRNLTISIDTSSSSAVGTSNVYGIHATGTAASEDYNFCAVTCSIFVNANGLGNKRGILNTGTGAFKIRNSEITVTFAGSDPSVTSYIGVETNNAGATAVLSSCIINSPQTADISQTQGTILSSASQLINGTSNDLNFTSSQACNKVCLGALTATSNANPHVMRYASINPVLLSSSTDSTILIQQPCVVKGMAARTRLAPGGASKIAWVLRKNLVDTPLSVSLSAAITSAINNTNAVTFNRGDLLSVKFLPVTGNLAANPTVTLDVY